MRLTAGDKDQTYAIQNSNYRNPDANKPMLATFKNDSASKSVNIYWINFNNEEQFYNRLSPQGTWGPVSTYVTHQWVIRDSETKDFIMYTEGLYDNQQFNIPKDDSVILLPPDTDEGMPENE